MEAPYSSDDITAARSLQTYAYIHVSMATFWTYDYIYTFNQEWAFLLQSRWSSVKFLYIITRYVPFLFFIGHLYLNCTNEKPEKCPTLATIGNGISLISVICSECFFILRTCILWKNNTVVLKAIVFTYFVILVASVSVVFTTTATAPYRTSGIPGITGCYQAEGSFKLFIPFLLLFVLELVLLSLTLIRAIQNWRITTGSLYVVLLNHNISYYACGLFFSVVNVVTSLLFKYAYSSLFQNFQVIILAILATRMHLHLWRSDRHLHDSDGPMFIPLSDVSSASNAL